jgi:GDP-L-fucose synthase
MQKSSKIYVAGHNGMVGSAIVRKLLTEGYDNILTRTSSELDLCNQQLVDSFFNDQRPEYVFLAAAKVGGIVANNTYRADFLYKNLMIECNIIYAAYKYNVKKLLFLGSSCIYPKFASQPIIEVSLLTGLLEVTNEPYAIAKIAGIKLCETFRDQYECDFISVMPTNLYGPNDNYDLETSHVLPAMIRKFYEATDQVVLWGTGNVRREFLHVDDLADACIFLMLTYSDKSIVNIGTGQDITIKELANLIKDVFQFKGDIIWDTTKPDGTPRKLLNVEKLNSIGFKYKISLEQGIKDVIKDYISNK